MENIYAGKFSEPSDNFQAVRDGRTSPVFYLDVDLSVSRTAANPLLLDFSGNSFYIDANPNDGVAVATFMQRDTGLADCPFYVSPGFIVNLPFTRVMFQNVAQAGKKIRVFYGVDVDFQPGAVSQIAVNGLVAQDSYTRYYQSQGKLYGMVNNISIPAASTRILFIRNPAASGIVMDVMNFQVASDNAAPYNAGSFNEYCGIQFATLVGVTEFTGTNLSNNSLTSVCKFGSATSFTATPNPTWGGFLVNTSVPRSPRGFDPFTLGADRVYAVALANTGGAAASVSWSANWIER